MSLPKFGGGSVVNSPKSGNLGSIEKEVVVVEMDDDDEEKKQNKKSNKKLINKAKHHQPNTMKVSSMAGGRKSSGKKSFAFNFGNIEEQEDEDSIRHASFNKPRKMDSKPQAEEEMDTPTK